MQEPSPVQLPWPSLVLVFFVILAFFVFRFPLFLCFSFFSKDFRGSAKRKTLVVFFSGFPCFFSKKQGLEGQGCLKSIAVHLFYTSLYRSKPWREGSPAIHLPYVVRCASFLYSSAPPIRTTVLLRMCQEGVPEISWFRMAQEPNRNRRNRFSRNQNRNRNRRNRFSRTETRTVPSP